MSEEAGVLVDQASLVSVAGRAESIGAAIHRAGSGSEESITQAAEAHQGTLWAIALGHAIDRWSSKMAGLGDDVTDVGAKLRATEAGYQANERANEQVLVGPNLPI